MRTPVTRRATVSSADMPGWPEEARLASRIIALPSSAEMRSELKKLDKEIRGKVAAMVKMQMRMFRQGPFLLYWCPSDTRAKREIQRSEVPGSDDK